MAHSEPELLWELLWVFLGATVGLSPTLCSCISNFQNAASGQLRLKKSLVFDICILTLIFAVDFFDAVVDLMIFFRVLINGADGRGYRYGILLGIMTILSRILTGVFGVYYKIESKQLQTEKHKVHFDNVALATLGFVETTVFMMEDGAAILYLANTVYEENTPNDPLTLSNLILTTVCGGIYCLFSLKNYGHIIETIRVLLNEAFPNDTVPVKVAKGAPVIFMYLTCVGFAISMIVLLVTEGWNKNDSGLSEKDSTSWLIVYAVGVFLCLLYSLALIFALEWSRKTVQKVVHIQDSHLGLISMTEI